MLAEVALAQAGGSNSAPPAIVSFLPLILVFVVFYFLLIRPQQKRAREHETMLANLKKNDEVITGGGIFGRVVELKDKIVTVEIAPGVRVRVSRPQISEVLSAPAAEKSSGSGKEKTKNTPD